MRCTFKRFSRAVIIILDGVGLGALPDAGAYGDEGSNSLGNTVKARGRLDVPNLAALGLNRLTALPGLDATPVAGAFGRMAMKATGKDSTSGHWEIAGVVLNKQFPLFPGGFPAEAIRALQDVTGYRFIGNRTASGTAIIDELGKEHLRTGALILYTSADSVCQIAAHVDVVPTAELYRVGETARSVMAGPWEVARVIVRPFEGRPESFARINGARRDFALSPPQPTLWDRLRERGLEVRGVGKVDDIFCGRGFSACAHAGDNARAMALLLADLKDRFEGALFANLNDTDTVYGHRNDVEGYARSLEGFDRALPALKTAMTDKDLLIIVSDHGNDPTTPSTDHSREYTPLLAWYAGLRRGIDLGTRSTLADVGQTVADNFGVTPLPHGVSFLYEI